MLKSSPLYKAPQLMWQKQNTKQTQVFWLPSQWVPFSYTGVFKLRSFAKGTGTWKVLGNWFPDPQVPYELFPKIDPSMYLQLKVFFYSSYVKIFLLLCKKKRHCKSYSCLTPDVLNLQSNNERDIVKNPLLRIL